MLFNVFVARSNLSFNQVAYQRILQLTYVDELLAALKTLFVKLFEPFLATFVASLRAISSGKVNAGEAATSWNFSKIFEGWDKVFDKLLRGLEDKAAQVGLSVRIQTSQQFTIKLQDRKSRLRSTVRLTEVDPSPPSDDLSTSAGFVSSLISGR